MGLVRWFSFGRDQEVVHVYLSHILRTLSTQLTSTTSVQMISEFIQAIQDEDNVEALLGMCHDFLKSACLEKIDCHLLVLQLPLDMSDPQKAAVITLLKMELIIFHTSVAVDHNEIQQYFKSLEQLNFSGQASEYLSSFLKAKYQDLLTDYNLCFSESAKRPRLVDLINKKLNILKLTSVSQQLTEDLQFKILIFYLLSEADLRKRNIHHYLNEEGVYSRSYDDAIKKYVDLLTGRSLIPLYIYNQMVEHLKSQHTLFRCLFDRYGDSLLEYYFENNIQRLPKYFKSIRITRVCSLLTEQNPNVDFEDLVFRMIVGRQLPEGTHIDQVNQMIIFGAKAEKYDAMNSRIKRIGEMVDSLAT